MTENVLPIRKSLFSFAACNKIKRVEALFIDSYERTTMIVGSNLPMIALL